jgi:hypothetical protein
MLMQRLARKRKTLAVAASMTLFASAFQAGGCTVNVDEGMLQTLTTLLEDVDRVHWGPGSVDFNDDGTSHDCEGHEPDEGDGGDGETSRCN